MCEIFAFLLHVLNMHLWFQFEHFLRTSCDILFIQIRIIALFELFPLVFFSLFIQATSLEFS